MYIENVTIGADPELFIINTKTNKVVSSVGLIPGEKGKPYRSEDMPEGYGLEIDNILAEFNIPPVRSEKEFLHAMNYMKDYIVKYVKSKNPDLDILCAASQMVDSDQLQSEVAKLFGCSADYNAYTCEKNPAPKGDRTNLRSAGCHIHIGYDNNNVETSLMLIKYLDTYLGLPAILKDPDTKRRQLYGKAGCFRLTDYGLEYRVLSGVFIKNDELLKFVWNQVFRAIDECNSEGYLISSNTIQDIINNSKVDEAAKYVKKLSINL